jgi:hypothetical protein
VSMVGPLHNSHGALTLVVSMVELMKVREALKPNSLHSSSNPPSTRARRHSSDTVTSCTCSGKPKCCVMVRRSHQRSAAKF